MWFCSDGDVSIGLLEGTIGSADLSLKEQNCWLITCQTISSEAMVWLVCQWTLADAVVETLSQNCLGEEKIWVRCQDFVPRMRLKGFDAPPTAKFNTSPSTTQREMAPISCQVPSYSDDEGDDYSEAEYEDGVEK